MKKRQQQQQRKRRNINRSSRIITKNFEIFVTDFLTNSCGLPVELKDCILVDGNENISN